MSNELGQTGATRYGPPQHATDSPCDERSYYCREGEDEDADATYGTFAHYAPATSQASMRASAESAVASD
ncbi:MAG: hypothetical protein ABEJ79_11015 [Halolamina sp.]